MESNANGKKQVKSTYKVVNWKEDTWKEISPEVKLTKATVEFGLEGELLGKANVEYLMYYSFFDPKEPHKSSAEYIGMMHIEGKLKGKSGTFSLDDSGIFEAGTAYSTLRILEGSGTGDFKGIRGTGKYRANQEGNHFELDYEL